MLIQTNDNRFFSVTEDRGHAYLAVEVKKVAGGYAPKKNAREQLVRKAGCSVVGA